MSERDVMEYDVVTVGAGPAGLAFAIRLKQLKPDLSVCVIEKASTIGAQVLSGAVIEPGPLDELLPGWRDNPPPVCVPATEDEFWFLTKTGGYKFPIAPPQMNNHGNFIVSLGATCAWLAPQAEALGVEIYPGFAAAETLIEDGRVVGVRIGDMGVAKDGSHKPGYTQGIDIRARITVLAEGARGHLAKPLIKQYGLDANSDPQSYSIGIKELWQVPEDRVSPGNIVHSLGWPADSRTYGGSFLYHLTGGRIALGYVSGLDYRDPNYQPYEAFQQWKHHPTVKPLLDGGSILSAGARAIVTGGYQSLPKVEMPGAILIGCDAGLVNVPKIKGVHQAMRSGMLAAEHIASTDQVEGWDAKLRGSVVYSELKKVRNFKPGFKKGLWFGLINSGWETVTGGASPWTLKVKPDWSSLQKLSEAARRRPARAPARREHRRLRNPVRRGIRQPLHPLLPGRRLRDGRRRGRQAPADQRRQLRPLQDLRHQGSLPDHQLGDARGRGWAELPEPVRNGPHDAVCFQNPRHRRNACSRCHDAAPRRK